MIRRSSDKDLIYTLGNKHIHKTIYDILEDTYIKTCWNKALQKLIYSSNISPNDINYIAVCGRGPSLQYINELSSINNFIIVNDFNNELDDPIVYQTLSNKNIIHMTNRVENTLSFKYLFNLNFVRYQLRMLESDEKDYFWYESRRDAAADFKGLVPHYLPEDLEDILNNNFVETGLRNIGTTAILFAAHYYQPDYIFCVGIDFFEQGDYFSKEVTDEIRREVKEKTKRMKRNMIKIVNLYPDTEFNLITTASFDRSPPNLNVYQRKILIDST